MTLALDIRIAAGDVALVGLDQLAATVKRLGRGGRAFTVREVAAALGNPRRRTLIAEHLRRLCQDGALVDQGFASGGPARLEQRSYTLAGGQATAPPEPTAHQRIWNTLRGPNGRRPLGADEVAMLASTEGFAVTAALARRYLKALAAAGYVETDRSRQQVRYRFLRKADSGPLAPVPYQVEVMLDRNLHQIASRRAEAKAVRA